MKAPFLNLMRRPHATTLPSIVKEGQRCQLRVLTGDDATTADELYFGRSNAGTMEWYKVTGQTGAYTDEQAQDAVGTIFTDSVHIDFTYTDATPAITAVLTVAARTQILNITINGGGSVIPTGVCFGAKFVGGTITAWEVDSVDSTTGSIVLDLWSDTYANINPTVADTITGSEKPTISSAIKGQDTSLNSGAGWAITNGNWVLVNVDSVTSLKLVTLALTFVRT
jgi:hypothetical protein